MARIISILGCGWFGFAFAKELIRRGYLVKGSTTIEDKLSMLSEAAIEPFLIDFSDEGQSNNPQFFETDVLFICIPPKRNSLELTDLSRKDRSYHQVCKENERNCHDKFYQYLWRSRSNDW